MNTSEITPEIQTRLSRAPEGTVIHFDDGSYVKQGKRLVRQEQTTAQSGQSQAVYERYGVGVVPPEQIKESSFMRRHVVPAIAPTIGQIGGAALGGLITAPTLAGVPGGVLAGEALGGIAGESLNQILGITEPSSAQIGLAGAAGGIGRGIGAGFGTLRRLAKDLPGAGAALRDWAAKSADYIKGMARPPVSSDVLYAKVSKFNPDIDLTPVKKMADKLSLEQGPRVEFGVQVPGGVGSVIDKTKEALDPTAIRNFQQIRSVMRGINDKIGSLKASGGEGYGEMLQLKKSFAEALEQSANPEAGPAFAALKEANMAYRNELAADTVTDIISKSVTPLEGRETWTIGAGKALKALNEAVRKDKFLEESFPPGMLDAIRGKLNYLRALPVPGAPPGADAGSKRRFLEWSAGTAAGGLVNYLLGGGVTAGIVAGTAGGFTAIGVANVVSEALLTDKGTAMLLRSLQPGKGLDRPLLAAISGITRAELAGSSQP